MHISIEREFQALETANKSIRRLELLSILANNQGDVLLVGSKPEDCYRLL